MNNDNRIRSAIDESLSGVRFNAHDTRSVLEAMHSSGQIRRPAHRRSRLLRFAVSAAAVAVILVPAVLFTMRAHQDGSRVTVIGGEATARPDLIVTAQPAATPTPLITPDPTPAPTAAPLSEDDAIRIVRACFERVCDTSVFTFEEYAVSAAYGEEGGAQICTVTMESIYDNGCRFTATVSCTDGSVLRHSTPRLATIPAYVNSESAEVRSWYEKNGAHLMTWPQDQQAEFSRRYEGGMLRTARDGEITADQAKQIAQDASQDALRTLGLPADAAPACYPMLYAEAASGDGIARYTVHCYAEPVSDALPSACVLVTLRADSGEVESVAAAE
ncbi:MAG: hypothetical protein J6K32_02630 [Clostridia bacterium]|nr:hypothetical protein [Clostridia bacterium]